jgi:hypothetical protein
MEIGILTKFLKDNLAKVSLEELIEEQSFRLTRKTNIYA